MMTSPTGDPMRTAGERPQETPCGAMTGSQVYSFLEAGIRTAKIATVMPDGRPHVVPVWFCVADDTLVFSTASRSVKARNLRRDPHVALTVDDERPYSRLSRSRA